jgi:hypothetical protein
MKKVVFLPYLVGFLLILSVTNALSQGWVITEADNSMTYISDGWIKSITSDEEMQDITFMFNANKDIIIMVDDANERYAKGSGEDYCNAMKSMRDEMNKKMPPEQLKMMEDMINEQKAKPIPKVTVEKGDGEEIAGFQTEKYAVYADGELFEEKWITTDQSLKNILDIVTITQELTSKIVKCGVPDESFLKSSPEFSPEYKKLEIAGIELKSIRYEFGSEDLQTDVISLEKEDIDSSEFEVPDGYSELSFKDIILAMSGM